MSIIVLIFLFLIHNFLYVGLFVWKDTIIHQIKLNYAEFVLVKTQNMNAMCEQ